MRVSHATLKLLAAAVWYSGGLVLLWNGGERLLDAVASPAAPAWPLTAGLLGLGIGVVQGRTVFRRACVRNLRRIRALESPRAWQFFRPGFFLALAAMVGGAAALAVIAETGPVATVLVGAVDWVIAFSLLVSGEAFWTWRPEGERGEAGRTETLEPTSQCTDAGAQSRGSSAPSIRR